MVRALFPTINVMESVYRLLFPAKAIHDVKQFFQKIAAELTKLGFSLVKRQFWWILTRDGHWRFFWLYRADSESPKWKLNSSNQRIFMDIEFTAEPFVFY